LTLIVLISLPCLQLLIQEVIVLLKHNIVNIRDANTFHNRVINTWNKLPDSIVLAPSIFCFKDDCLDLCVISFMIIFSLSSFLFFYFPVYCLLV